VIEVSNPDLFWIGVLCGFLLGVAAPLAAALLRIRSAESELSTKAGGPTLPAGSYDRDGVQVMAGNRPGPLSLESDVDARRIGVVAFVSWDRLASRKWRP